MSQIATITSKRQLTIPVALFKKARLKEYQKVLVEEEGGIIKIQPTINKVLRLSGSVKIPKRLKDKTLKQVIEISKGEYFSQKFGKSK
ncbi:hypothetical protein A3A54_00280 [Candidatus Curtissbacteria bacterium RIFCSPLOWO2_01_FULL_39_62]|uniref:SpoVT-AbrB domain-containing protein n=2 Tax=Candidatus Curtissiibacteriota TaxID=1752717 RepID=A0A1F5GAN8_9BACT|nr:MAG: hypothetical protein A2775_00800 [Candidatus Curtissbacteria bacterium RIFCSPHIGHO2_01_FULL_39_57]OGD88952.1 MAG: hypothetical protein A3D04_02030 [Candidatus Curtissbacteria bacterium RIFCSPHIGHO2_02_FULL_40_16b]OGD90702.1 MAG: hypothetical protein A3E11_01025 [Candidatus Curtissbacteria bacterium RIFCSPHIGHO2_12_FULL_38_37]OGE00709.1 MAG: hypothetical protein A3J17_04105 [Candidatus Curtissbacteria bacterium RIFCSPLOWO2_02_FULL_40_11]OGE02451.1 MAG: hypothetical protein A3A54_00280 [C